MACNIQKIEAKLNILIKHYEPLFGLTNTHLGDFFTHNLWTNLIPSEIQDEVKDGKSATELVEIYPEIIKGNCPPEFSSKYPHTCNFIKSTFDITIIKDSSCVTALPKLTNELLSCGCSLKNEPNPIGFYSEKKLHEVKEMARIVSLLSDATKTSCIVDIGGGKGYLSSILALYYHHKVLGVDCSEKTTCGAVKRSKRLVKYWNGVFKKEKNGNHVMNEEYMKQQYKQVISFITAKTDLLSLVHDNFNEECSDLTLAGLHTCGDLASTCLRMFVTNEKAKSLVNIGCCYHHIKEEFGRIPFWEGVDFMQGEYDFGFPMSQFLKNKKFHIGRNAAMVSANSLARIADDYYDGVPERAMFYKALLDVVADQKTGNSLPHGFVKGLGKKHADFLDYMNAALKNLDIDMMSEDEIMKVYNDHKEKEPFMRLFYLLRVTVGPVVESIILLDRLLYLHEQGIENSHLVQLFDYKVSPRGFALIAWKEPLNGT